MDVPIEVTMPKLSPTMETGVIAQWLVKVGDQVKEGDVLAEIETDKATMSMKAYDEGTIVRIDHAAGEEVAVGERVMVLAKKGEDPKDLEASLGRGPPKAAPEAGSAAPAPPAEPRPDGAAAKGLKTAKSGDRQQGAASGDGEEDKRRPKISPLARKLAESSHIDLTKIKG